MYNAAVAKRACGKKVAQNVEVLVQQIHHHHVRDRAHVVYSRFFLLTGKDKHDFASHFSSTIVVGDGFFLTQESQVSIQMTHKSAP